MELKEKKVESASVTMNECREPYIQLKIGTTNNVTTHQLSFTFKI